ncbi:MAG: hypothetical protein QM628_18195 [Propionicimonas sp.]
MSTLLSQLRTAASLIKDKGISVAKKTMLSKKGKAAAAATLLWGGLNVAMDLVGLGDCYDFFTGKY